MSGGPGRSWRLHKTRRSRDTRRLQIVSVSVFLTSLIAGVIYLLTLPRVPVLRFLFVTENSFESDSTGITPLPPGSAEFNIARLKTLAQRFHKANPQRISVLDATSSLSELAAGLPLPHGESLIIYCSAEAWCVPDEDNAGQVLVELLPGRRSETVALTAVLAKLSERKPAQTVLLLELSGRQRGLATGSLSDDVSEVIRHEVEAAKINGLTVICACSRGERSWEYVSSPATRSNESEVATNTAKPPVSDSLPEFQGTAFGHFLAQAFVEGKAASPEELFQFLKPAVQSWVAGNFGETQTVWMVPADGKTARTELLRRTLLPNEPELPKSGDGPANNTSTSAAGSAGAIGPDDGKSSIDAATPAIDDSPAARLEMLSAHRDELRRQATAPLLMPAEWIRLQTELLSAEQLVMNGDRQNFSVLYDASLKQILNQLSGSAESHADVKELQSVRDWITVRDPVTREEESLFRGVFDDFIVEPGKTPRLPPELRVPGRARHAFVSWLIQDLNGLSQFIEDASVEDQAKRVRERLSLLTNLAANGWGAEEFPEQLSTVREILRGEDFTWLARAIKPLVRLLELRQQVLQLAVGEGPNGLRLRQESWIQIEPEIDRILMTLHTAERWLSVGPAGRELATDRLDRAELALKQLLNLNSQKQRLQSIRDAQRFELPYLIQYLALCQEAVSLPAVELSAARRMAEMAVNGAVDESEFPGGQLDAIRFTRAHIDAMFALTRDFSKPMQEVSESDERHWRLLQSYLNDRSKTPLRATEQLQLLSIPTLPDREILLTGLIQSHAGRSADAPIGSSHSGIWLSFWSLRLVEAISPSADAKPLWQQWSDFVSAVADPKSIEVPSRRSAMAQLLRIRWSEAMQQLQRTDSSKVFPPASEIMSLIAKDVQRRLAATVADNRILYSSLLRTLSPGTPEVAASWITTADPGFELTNENTAQASVRINRAAGVFVLNDGVSLANEGTLQDGNWSHLKVDAMVEKEVTLELKLSQTATGPKPVTIFAVNDYGAVTASTSIMLHPAAETSWDIEVMQVVEGIPEGKEMILEDAGQTRRLRLLPSTLDAMTKMHAPTALRFRLKQERGAARKIKVQLFRAADGTPFWPNPVILEFAEGTNTVDLPLHPPATTTATAAQPTSPAAAVQTALEFSKGITIEITPEDLRRKVSTRITIIPEFAEPEQFVVRPIPQYDPDNNVLEIRVERADDDDTTALQPARLPVEVVFSDKLSKYVMPGVAAPVPSLTPDGHTFKIKFRPEVEQVIGDDGIEFGLSLAGIPHAWWWRLSDGIQTPIGGDVPEIRTFLTVINNTEVKPVADLDDLMLGEGWQKSRLLSETFVYGGDFDSTGWQLNLDFQRRETDGRDPVTESPFPITSRFVETVTVAAGENSVWLFSTTTEPYSPPPLDPVKLGLENGRYDLITSLRQNVAGADSIEWPVAFAIDDSGPELTKFETVRPRTKTTEVLQGRIVVTDLESGVKAIRVGLVPDMLELLTITPGDEVEADFKLDASKGFPPLLQMETINVKDVTLYIEADNHAGKTTKMPRPVTFYLPGKAGKTEELPPGSIEVTFNSGTTYVVSVTGPQGKLPPKAGKQSVVFDGLPVGEYDVEWKTEGGLVPGSEKKVKVRSGKPTKVVGRK